jgi:hypothetical protein
MISSILIDNYVSFNLALGQTRTLPGSGKKSKPEKYLREAWRTPSL